MENQKIPEEIVGAYDYAGEVSKLDKQSKYWKPSLGIHRVVCLSEPGDDQYVDGEKVTPQIRLQVEVNGEHYEWAMSKGSTSESLFGQLMILGNYHKKLVGVPFTLMVNTTGQGEKKRKTYMVQEAIKIKEEMNQQ